MNNVTAALPRRMLADFKPAVYQGVMSAIVRVLAADSMSNATRQSWQKLIDSGPRTGGFRALLSARDQFDYDCILHALLHRELCPAHWDVLVGRFSTHKANRVGAIARTIPRLSSPAPALFIYKAATVWFIPKMKGKQGKRSTDVAILPDEFYDMNTWDTEARPDSTRSRWRRGIHQCLEALEEGAVVHVTEILEEEQLID
ncbi:hypothetical protein [Pseudomonas chlororaphis]|uniref:hypothetical protein n=1 Tax=Pseudomonas chlororaphis TaxID=587753 RepID=UPI001B317A38|nr:hypothetical protein [Pseudomonas chlororaphis]MBP5054336.1 hypothetical protein [Pseudomonas chlororaphis]MBP5140274.1 hypothetical protein [Pseudomonas chlororaphis]QTT99514.1 hypothetical protein HUT26_09590 [Pseudomonas chlororaphis]